jgi:glycosyltransferase involved in cell wall biosynthesis
MKIAILGPVVTDKYFGGVATFDEALAEGFIELGHRVKIYTSQQGSISNRRLDIKQLKKTEIAGEVNREKTDLTIASLQSGTLLKKINTGRKIYFLHGFFNVQSYGIAKTLAATVLTKQMTGYADCVIANSNLTAAVNQRIWNISVDGVAHLGVDEEFIRKVTPTAERNPEELKRILFVGRLAVSKHVERVIGAVALLDQSSYELVLAGDGPERERLQKTANDLKVNAKFLGRVEHDKVAELYKRCGTFISLSESEPYGLTYAEALVAGCKIVCPVTGGQVEFLMDYPDRVSFVDVLGNQSIAEGIKKCLNTGNVSVNEELLQKFRYLETAKRILEIDKP